MDLVESLVRSSEWSKMSHRCPSCGYGYGCRGFSEQYTHNCPDQAFNNLKEIRMKLNSQDGERQRNKQLTHEEIIKRCGQYEDMLELAFDALEYSSLGSNSDAEKAIETIAKMKAIYPGYPPAEKK